MGMIRLGWNDACFLGGEMMGLLFADDSVQEGRKEEDFLFSLRAIR